MKEGSPNPTPSVSSADRTRKRRLLAVLLLSVMIGLLTAIGILMSSEFREAVVLREAVNRSYEARIQIGHILSIHQDIETGQRGYLLSGDPRYRQPYDDALPKLEREFAVLRSVMGDRPEEQRQIAGIEALSREKIAHDQNAIRLRDRDPMAGMPELDLGKQAMDKLRLAVAELQASEKAQLDKQESMAVASRRVSQRIGFGLLILLDVLLFGSAYLIVRAARLRSEALVRLEDVSLRNRAILDNTIDAIITLNPSGSIESMNQAAAKLYGYSEEELLRRDVGKLFATPPADGQIPAYLKRLSGGSDEGGLTREILSRRRDGSLFPTDVAVSPMQLVDGIRYVAVIRDITERKRVEQMKSEFVSTVSHELRTPLTSIAGSLGLLAGGATGELPERAAKLVGIAHSNSERLVRLINDILDIEKIESGKMVFNKVPVPLLDLVERTVEANRGFAEKFGAAVTVEGSSAEGAEVSVDPDRLMQVLTNLLSNAIKFSGEGGQVRVEITPGDDWHRVTVRDNGPGIDEAFQSRLFERFAQEDSSNTRQKGGTGLGLAIVREIVTRLGGRISFVSRPGEGTAFHVDLPPLRVEQDGRRSVLLASADPIEAARICRMLTETGHLCEVADSAAKARKLAAERLPLAVLVDLVLPDDSGIALIRALRKDPRLTATPILVVAGEGEDMSEALAVVDWLAKPVAPDKVADALLEALAAAPLPASRILHVDDDPDVLKVVATALESHAEVTSVTGLEKARQALVGNGFDLVILDLGLADGSGLELLPYLRHRDGTLVPVVIFSAQDADPALASKVDAVLTKSRTSLGRLVQTVEELIFQGRTKGGRNGGAA